MTARLQPAAALAAQLGEGLWLAASPNRAWLSETAPDTTQAITAASVRRLLDGAMAAALLPATPRHPPGHPLTPARWIWRLVGYFHLTRSIPALLDFASERFAAANQPALAEWTRARARAHDQHDQLVLRDLQAMNVDPVQTILALRPHPAERLVAWLRACVLTPDPIGCVGHAHAIERLAFDKLGTLEARLPDGVRAQCARVHADDHIEETVALLTRLSATRCEAVARAAFEVACICVVSPHDAPDDAAIRRRLSGSLEVRP